MYLNHVSRLWRHQKTQGTYANHHHPTCTISNQHELFGIETSGYQQRLGAVWGLGPRKHVLALNEASFKTIAQKSALTELLQWEIKPMTEDQGPNLAYGVLGGYLLPVRPHGG